MPTGGKKSELIERILAHEFPQNLRREEPRQNREQGEGEIVVGNNNLANGGQVIQNSGILNNGLVGHNNGLVG